MENDLIDWIERYAAATKLAERFGNKYGDMDAASHAWRECKKRSDELLSLRKRVMQLEFGPEEA